MREPSFFRRAECRRRARVEGRGHRNACSDRAQRALTHPALRRAQVVIQLCAPVVCGRGLRAGALRRPPRASQAERRVRLFVEVCLGAHARALGARSPPCAMTACARDLSPLTQMHTIHSGAAHTPPSAAAAAVQGAAAAARHLGSLPSQPPPLRRRCRGCNAANAPSPSATLRKSAGRRRQIFASARPPRPRHSSGY